MDTRCQTISPDSIQAALERMLASPTFARSHQLQRFLELTVTRTLEGRRDELKEYLIAVEACGRKSDHDPRIDAIVRTEAQRLRQKLTAYYEDEGADEPVRITYPKGSYVPRFETNGHGAKGLSQRAQSLKPSVPRVAVAAILATTIIAAATFTLAGHAQKVIGARIVVMTFDDLSTNQDQGSLALATTEALMVRLSREPGLDVIAKTITLPSASAGFSAESALQADYVLKGSVQRSGERSRVTAQLIRARDDTNVWAEHYTFDRVEIFEVQDTVAEAVANQLRTHVVDGQWGAALKPVVHLDPLEQYPNVGER